MPLICLIFITLGFLVLNYLISDWDFINPSVLFCLVNLLYFLAALTMQWVYSITIHWNTVAVFSIGMLIFTIMNFLSWGLKVKVTLNRRPLFRGLSFEHITINPILMNIFILFEILVAVFIVKYAFDVVRAVNGSGSGIFGVIGALNDLSKNSADAVRATGVDTGIIYAVGWPLIIAFNSILCVVGIIDKLTIGKFPRKIAIAYIIMIFMSFLRGSRSMAFTFITMFAIQYILVKRIKQKSYHKGNSKLMFKLLFYGAIVAVALFASVSLIGRSQTFPIFEYVTAYIGAPVFNFDIFLNGYYASSKMFAQETLHNLYSFIGNQFGIDKWIYDLSIPYIWHENKYYFGNVYTMYRMFIQDFGFWGIVPCTTIIAWFYNFSYKKLMDFRHVAFTPSLVIYSYLFNDLLMLMFSNRFFETAMGSTFIRVLFCLIVLWSPFSKRVLLKKQCVNMTENRKE